MGSLSADKAGVGRPSTTPPASSAAPSAWRSWAASSHPSYSGRLAEAIRRSQALPAEARADDGAIQWRRRRRSSVRLAVQRRAPDVRDRRRTPPSWTGFNGSAALVRRGDRTGLRQSWWPRCCPRGRASRGRLKSKSVSQRRPAHELHRHLTNFPSPNNWVWSPVNSLMSTRSCRSRACELTM